MAALTLLQKHIHRRELSGLLGNLTTLLLAENMTGQQLASLIHYLIQAGETSNAKAFIRELAQRVPQHGDELMTIAQQLEQKGMEKGMEKGGRETALKIVRTMLQNGIDRKTIMKLTGLTENDMVRIGH